MQIYEENENIQTDNRIDLWDLAETMWKNFRRYWGRLLLLVIIVTVGFTGYMVYSYHPVYESYVTFVVTKDNTNTVDSVVTARIAKSFSYLLRSGGLENRIRKEIGLMNGNSLPATLTASSMEDTNLLTVTAVSASDTQGQQVIDALILYLPDYVTEVVGNVTLTVIDQTGLNDQSSNALSIPKTVLKGGILGVLAVLVILFLLAYNDSTIRRYEDLKKHLNIPCLGTIPLTKFKKRNHKFDSRILITNDKIPATFLEAMNALKTRTEKEMKEKNVETLLVSSSIPGEGKTTVSLNLAIAFAERDKKVLLIDGDLRNPSVHTNLEIAQKDIQVGITDVLRNRANPGQAIINYKGTTLDLLLGRKSVGNASELLSSRRMQETIEELADYYDYVIIDTPPSAMMSDASELAAFVDGALYVIRQDYAQIKYITEGIGLLSDTGIQVLGCVLNCAENGFGSYGYGKYGKYGYGYSKYNPENE